MGLSDRVIFLNQLYLILFKVTPKSDFQKTTDKELINIRLLQQFRLAWIFF